MTYNPRKIAVDIIYDVLKNSSSLSEKLANLRENNKDIKSLDLRFIAEITSGVLRNLEYVDFLISNSSSIRLNKISPYPLCILRVGAYQIVFMDKVPVSAAVNECVKLTKKSKNSRLSGFVNAVLHNIDRTKDKISLPRDSISNLSIKYSCPKWIVEKLTETLGEETEELLKSFNKKPETTLRVNTIKTSRDELIESLNSKGWECTKFESELFPGVDYLVSASKVENISRTFEYENGLFYVQDPAAAFAGEVLNPTPGSIVIDMCASPGGKTTHFAQIMKDTGKIYAFDVSQKKINKIKENAQRLGFNSISCEVKDSSQYDDKFFEKADFVLVDAPCSGFGIVRKKPDIKYLRKEEDIKALSKISLSILDVGAKYLKKGGMMVFSTCTVFKEENEDVLFEFLRTHPQYKLKKIPCSKENSGFLTLYPHRDNCDGFFISLMIKE